MLLKIMIVPPDVVSLMKNIVFSVFSVLSVLVIIRIMVEKKHVETNKENKKQWKNQKNTNNFIYKQTISLSNYKKQVLFIIYYLSFYKQTNKQTKRYI